MSAQYKHKDMAINSSENGKTITKNSFEKQKKCHDPCSVHKASTTLVGLSTIPTNINQDK
jgi:hypothetical protein